MGTYTMRRLLQAVPLLLGVMILTFVLIQYLPGGPLSLLAHNRRVNPDQLRLLRHNLGLDQPGYVQFLHWFGGILHGDWGTSFTDNRPVLTDIGERLPATMLLMGSGFLISLILAMGIGILAATHRNGLFDHASTLFAFFGLAMPVFWFGLMLQLLFAVHLGWLPAADMNDERGTPTLVGSLQHLILPALTLGITSIAGWSRYLRASLQDAVEQDYVRTARAKGVPRRRIVTRHALRNALIPLATVMALDLPGYFTGSVVVETVFSWPGMGRLFFQSLNQHDYPVELGLLLISSALIILGNLVADLVYGLLDPRITYS
jgi:peptide/nickel transport system permease protein